MSKHRDYTSYSNREQRAEDKLMEEVANQVNNAEFEVPTEETETEQLVMDEVAVEPFPEFKQGVVTDCVKLNVRKEPDPEAEVVAKISVGTKLEVYEGESTDDFYKIWVPYGVEGYCMKQFISILP